ncbi:ATP-binding protein [Streptomyces sp. SYSU K21746]
MHAEPGPVQERSAPEQAFPISALVSGRRLSFLVTGCEEAVPAARGEVAAQLDMWGLPRDCETAQIAVLAVSELVTNYVQHAAGSSPTAGVALSLEAGHLVLAVHDRAPSLPRPAAAVDGDQLGGRGLFLVKAMADAAGGATRIPVDADGAGKAVEVRLPLSGIP